MADDEVASWLRRLASGDERAAQEIWNQYYEKLLRLARRKLLNGSRRVEDEEDVALSAINSFCEAAAAGRYPQLHDHSDLWRLLVTITARRAARQMRRSRRQKRGSGKVRGDSVFRDPHEGEQRAGIDAVLGAEPTPEMAALAAEECQRLLNLLPDESLRQVAKAKLEGFTNEEIAERLGCAPRTVERKLTKIRIAWQVDDEVARMRAGAGAEFDDDDD
jgi:RNA polymerase sigma factor (sigma-70 family)